MHIESTLLQHRLKHCLLTIVELEPVLSKIAMHSEIITEFQHLRTVISNVSEMSLCQEEVDRIEAATNLFLSELEIPLSYLEVEKDRLLQ